MPMFRAKGEKRLKGLSFRLQVSQPLRRKHVDLCAGACCARCKCTSNELSFSKSKTWTSYHKPGCLEYCAVAFPKPRTAYTTFGSSCTALAVLLKEMRQHYSSILVELVRISENRTGRINEYQQETYQLIYTICSEQSNNLSHTREAGYPVVSQSTRLVSLGCPNLVLKAQGIPGYLLFNPG